MIRSKPAALQAASTSGRAALISLLVSRVARLRMKTRCRSLPFGLSLSKPLHCPCASSFNRLSGRPAPCPELA